MLAPSALKAVGEKVFSARRVRSPVRVSPVPEFLLQLLGVQCSMFDVFQLAPPALPLPAGEGRGEGERFVKSGRSNLHGGFTLTLALSLEGEGIPQAAIGQLVRSVLT
ncbi:MAG: hypothetical protein N3I86_14615, partial [Verrucomicrobiae bacterium]|nr:hypothetical protein [Verrucomicrobiae bacterium]